LAQAILAQAILAQAILAQAILSYRLRLFLHVLRCLHMASTHAPRQRAVLVIRRATGDVIYVNDAAVAHAYLTSLGTQPVAVDEDLQRRSAVSVAALTAHHDLNVVAGTPSHSLGLAAVHAEPFLSRTETRALRSLRRKANNARHTWPSVATSTVDPSSLPVDDPGDAFATVCSSTRCTLFEDEAGVKDKVDSSMLSGAYSALAQHSVLKDIVMGGETRNDEDSRCSVPPFAASVSGSAPAAAVPDGVFSSLDVNFSNELTEFMAPMLTDVGLRNISVQSTRAGIEVVIRASRTRGLFLGSRVKNLGALVRKRFGLPDGSLDIFVDGT